MFRRLVCGGACLVFGSRRVGVLSRLAAACLALASSFSRCLLAGPADKSDAAAAADHAQSAANAGTGPICMAIPCRPALC